MKLAESFLNSWQRWVRYVPGVRAERPGELAVALGFDRDARLLNINLDDAGMCDSHNDAVRDVLEGGGASSCTVMTTTPGFGGFAAMARAHPRWSVGVHLVLNSEWPRLRWRPLLGPGQVPSLVDREGWMHATLVDVLRHARAEEVRAEWRAQLHRALDAGIRVDHVDCHMGPYHFRPDLFRIAADLAREHRLAMRAVLPWRQQRVRAAGVPCGERAVIIRHREKGQRLWRTDDERRAQLLDVLGNVPPGVVSFWWTHVSTDAPEWRAIRPPDGDLAEEDYPGEHRDQYEERLTDWRVLRDPSFARALAARGVQLIGYDRLQALAPA